MTLKDLVARKDRIERHIDNLENKFKTSKLSNIVFGIEHDNIIQAIAADLVDIIPIAGEITNISRIRNSKTKSRRTLQSIDLVTGVIPFANILTPTNTILFIEGRMRK